MPEGRSSSTGIALRTGGTLASIVILVFLLRKEGWSDVQSALGKVVWWHALLGFVVVCISRLATAGRWHMLLHALDIKIPLKRSLSLTFAGLFAVNFLPTSVGGDVARLAGAVQLGYDSARITASLVLDRIIGLAGFMFVIPFALPGLTSKAHIPLNQETSLLVLSSGLTDSNPTPKQGIIHRAIRFAKESLGALGLGMKRPVYLLSALCFTFVHMLCFFSTVSLILTGMGEHMGLLTIALLWSIVYLVTLIPFSINGLGWQEVSITYVFSHADDVFTQAGHVSFGAAVAVAVLMRAFMIIASLPGAVLIPSIMAARQQDSAD